MVLGFFIILIFLAIEILIGIYLIYDLVYKKEKNIKTLKKDEVRSIIAFKKVIVLENFLSLLLYTLLINNKEILKLGGEVLTLEILISMAVMTMYLYSFERFICKFKELNKLKKQSNFL